MTRELSLSERRDAIDERLEGTLETARGDYLLPARTAVVDRDDRWYGQLVALVANSVTDAPDSPSILRAATAMELFRGYSLLRERLLARLDTPGTEAVAWESNAALLAADYLQTAAYSMLGSLEGTAGGACIERLATVSERLVETLADADFDSQPTPAAYRSFVDGTAGALGRGAADIGATLAAVDDRQRGRFETVGRGGSVERRIRDDVATDTVSSRPGPRVRDDRQLRRYARAQHADATRALRTLSSTADVDSLREFLGRNVPTDPELH
ncbi:polyprenyl synthetase [Natrinema thermotolerans]|uniref:Polyprenyl synthetase n=1 Tax=Natrinema thermotolerans TaxID=121872 RepID=A0AAF0PD75_9EURY|nr:polyprenyl synthetase [Natrinema thermotolerans]QCC57991.1 polyprenyl synthetase [Natrinema thermotolerans]WMT09087.1 polyprenyl synthetase [Natrinema thermotolerans]